MPHCYSVNLAESSEFSLVAILLGKKRSPGSVWCRFLISFGVVGGVWILIASVPGHCSFMLTALMLTYKDSYACTHCTCEQSLIFVQTHVQV